MFPTASIVLAVGVDAAITGAHQRPTRWRGIFLHTAPTTAEAVTMLRTGDFDLVLLGDSIPAELRHRFVAAIRRLGFSVPVVCVTAAAADTAESDSSTCASGIVVSERRPIAAAITQLLTHQAGKSAAKAPIARPIALPRIKVA